MDIGPIIDGFSRRLGGRPALLVRAPGRVNLIGEHTDYNDGFVLPFAIDRSIQVALRPRDDGAVRLFSSVREAPCRFDIADLRKERGGWEEYVKGVAWALSERGFRLRGWEGVLESDLPAGAGLSSSAALEVAVARAFAAVSGFSWDPLAMAGLCRKAENAWVGVPCGVMDQIAVAASSPEAALLVDCRAEEILPVPLPQGFRIAVLDTGTRRALTDGFYRDRREDCLAAARRLGVPALRDACRDGLERLDGVLLRRARHVVSENARVLDAAEALRRGEAAAFGRLLDGSHASLRDDFEVTGEALDAMVEGARGIPGCLGARMTGAGFGGCAIAFVRAESAEAFLPAALDAYRRRTGREGTGFLTRPSPGATAGGIQDAL